MHVRVYTCIYTHVNCTHTHTHTHTQFPGHWILSHTMPLDYPVLSLSWNKEGKQLLIGGEILSLWAYSVNENGSVLLPDPDSSVTGEGGSEGVWGELWRCALALPAVHLMFSPDGTMFATASKDDHFVKIWYHSKAGVCVCVYIYMCVCVRACVRACVCIHCLYACIY